MADVIPWRNLSDFIVDNLEQHYNHTNDPWLSSLLMQIYDRKSLLEGNVRASMCLSFVNFNGKLHFPYSKIFPPKFLLLYLVIIV
jgi:hypothetical protein